MINAYNELFNIFALLEFGPDPVDAGLVPVEGARYQIYILPVIGVFDSPSKTLLFVWIQVFEAEDVSKLQSW